MKNIATRVKSFFGLRLFVVSFFLVLFWLTGYQIGFREKLENGPTVVKESSHLLGLSVKAPEEPSHKLKEVEYEELSPSRTQKAIEYHMIYNEQLYDDYYNEFFINQRIIAVEDTKTRRETYVFTGEERTGRPHWLSDHFIFFSYYCGTSCQGLYLVNSESKETHLAVLSYVFDDTGSWTTHFRDWFDGEFAFRGLVGEITSSTAGGASYLIFKMKDGDGNPLGEKRLLFTGRLLEAI